MKLDLDNTGGNFIRGFSGREVLVGSEAFTRPLIVTAERIIADWSPPAVAELTPVNLAPVLALEPELILLGTGARQLFPSVALTADILGRGIGFEVMDTAAACRTYNVLASEYRRVAAALFIE